MGQRGMVGNLISIGFVGMCFFLLSLSFPSHEYPPHDN